jgi:hypothetical protein
MIKIPIWAIYSYWVFAMTILWLLGRLPFSPLLSAVLAFIGSFFPVFFNGSFNQANGFIIATHLVPIWILRNTSLDLAPNALVFLVYNLILFVNGTNFIKIYKTIFTHAPTTIHEYLCQRDLITC